MLEAYGWSDLTPALVGKPGGTTPYAHKSAEQTEAEETLLSRLVHLNAERAAGQESLITGEPPEPAQPAGSADLSLALTKETSPGKALSLSLHTARLYHARLRMDCGLHVG